MSGFSPTGLDSRDKIDRMSPTLNRDAVLGALKVVTDPDLRRDIVSLGFVKDVAIEGGSVSFTIELPTPACPVKDQMRDQASSLPTLTSE